ncbi:hypothetical protein ERC79_15625 [Rhodococcus sp. ABRD24]|uniref:hypothetical protein n=1 Tax=Rhodococcus sp. ABRD24 TaxID=2507582 RepID=UPI00103BF27C|nr:hypothetical protein [Rhodococcus sp. ABRD24]QBJ97212.1 hypothetical protein ERC79_15625 [Rhodococcus sp. ABRD24]
MAPLLRLGRGAAGHPGRKDRDGNGCTWKGTGTVDMNFISNTRETTPSGIRSGSISTEEIKSRIAAMFGDTPAPAHQDK